MANPVNPPPFLRVPKAFLKDPEVRTFIEQQNIMLFQLYRKLGGTSDPVSEIGDQGITSFSALLQQVTKQLDGLPEFTIDTSGFTTDLTFITTDKAVT
jgi:hypothetical protein